MTQLVRVGLVVLAVVVLVSFGYMGWEGSHRLVHLDDPHCDCRTPAQVGMPYEAMAHGAATRAATAR